MDCKFILLADAANLSREGKLNIAGEFNSVFAVQVPVVWPSLMVVSRMEASLNEGLDHSAQLKISDADGGVVYQSPLIPIKFGKWATGMPTRADLIFGIVGLQLPAFGDYSVAIFIDGVKRGDVSLFVRQPPQAALTAGG